MIGAAGVSVHDVSFDRTGRSQKYHVQVSIQCISKSFQQQATVEEKLKAEGYKFSITRTNSPFKVPILAAEETSFKITAPAVPSDSTSARKKTIEDVTPESIRIAYNRVRNNINITPLYHDNFYSQLCGCEVYLKFDNIQKTGSFKVSV